MGSEACCRPAPPSEHTDLGFTTTFAGLKAYVNPGPPDATAAIILITDLFGFEAPLLRKLADRCAAEGFFAIIPDFLLGDPYVRSDAENPFAQLPSWLARHPATDVTDAKAVVEQLKKQGIQKVGATGCCWGGKMAITLAIEDPSVIDSAVLFHPSLVTHDDVRSIKVPVQFLIPEVDTQVTAEKAEEFKAILAIKEVDSHLKMFPNTKHGWCIRYNGDDPKDVKAANDAHDDMLEWYTKHLKK